MGRQTMTKGRSRIRTVFFIFLTLAFGAARVSSQTPDAASKFRLAGALEQAGDLEHASQLYRDLTSGDPLNAVYTEALQRTLVQLKRYDEAIALVNSRLERFPGDISSMTALGTLNFRAGREKEAAAAWDRVLALDPSNPNLYRIVASAQVENRLLDRAADTYRRGRSAIGDQTLFTLELSQLLVATMDYKGATLELLAWLEQNPAQTNFVQSRLTSFSSKPDGRNAAIGVIRDALRGKEDLHVFGLLAWLYMEGRDYDRAYEAYVEIDRLAASHGLGILSFADRAAHDRVFADAARAYREALSMPLPEERRPAAMLGYATALKEMSGANDSTGSAPDRSTGAVPETRSSGGAASAFNDIVTRYPHTRYAAISLFQIGVIRMEQSDLGGAQEAFDRAREEPAAPPALRYDIGLNLGALAILKADTAAARTAFQAVSAAPDASPDQSDEANFRLAEIEYFAGRFENASRLLDAMSLNLKADIANDALALKAFLSENLGTPDALAQFARADLLARQHRNAESIALFQQVIRRFPQTLLIDDALMKVAALQAGAGLFQDAITTYRTLLEKFKESSISLDRAQFQMAEVYEVGMKNIPAAIGAYQQLLAAYPNSLLAEQARKKIRALRGEAQ